MNTEVWKGLVDFPNYQVSSLGRVRSLNRYVKHFYGGLRLVRGRVLKVRLVGRGYHGVTLCSYGVETQIRVHRLVAENFVPNPENKPFVNHIDGDKTNNNYENLEWCTHSENIQHAWDTGLINVKGGKNV